MTEKQFEDKLLKDFRLVNKNVIQVNIFHVQYNDTYIGRVYLRTEQDGKDFIIDYSTKRKDIFKNYKEQQGIITFNINVDTKTLRKIKQAERKAKETENKIKIQSEANRREHRRAPNGFPIPGLQGMPPMPINLGPNIVIPSMQSNIPPPPGLGGINPIGQIPMGPLGGFPGSVMKPPGLQNNFPQNPTDGIRQRIKHIVKDKANFINSNQDSTKRLLS